MTEEKQAVVEDADDQSKEKSETGAEDTGAREQGDDLEKLLSEYEQKTASDDKSKENAEPNKQPEKQTQQPDEDLRKRLDALEQQRASEKNGSDMEKAIARIRGDNDAEIFDDDFVEGWINAQARKDARVGDIWVNRDSNPQPYQQLLDKMGQRFTKLVKAIPDKQATEDREAVADAVRGASKKAPDDDGPDLDKVKDMSDADFESFVNQVDAGA